MKPIKLALAIPLALAGAAVPALAHADPAGYGFGHQAGWDQRGNRGQTQMLRSQLFQLDRQIDRGQSMRRLTPREAYGLRSDLMQIDRQIAFAQRGGLDRFEQRMLQQKIDMLRLKLDRRMHDFDRPGFGQRDGYRDYGQRTVPVQALPRGR